MVSFRAFLSIWRHEICRMRHHHWNHSLSPKHIPYHAWHSTCHCLTLKTVVCTGRSVFMCRLDPLTMWTWRMSCARGSASTPQPRTCRLPCRHLFHTDPDKFRLHDMYRFRHLDSEAWGFSKWIIERNRIFEKNGLVSSLITFYNLYCWGISEELD